ncbi:PREDICTED: dentin matrix acidic phosphoprotein 1 [Acanthisitta chloris]|uniref:dentin matrix acidic phosphoprotein 1 n=1 Tax=Acanthisitta chloris TaxID=57068 RepID=UPI0004F0C8ED|nr:PREDICTED: dentin matrix acidic phosphoprotein 1 [Acanthisitta chloris]
MRTVFLLLLLWAVACAHPVPGREPTYPSAQQKDTANEDYINVLDGGEGRHAPASAERGDNALARDLVGGNDVDEELGKYSGRDKGDPVGQAQHVNQVDHEDMSAHNRNDLGFLEEDARDDGDNREHYSPGVHGLPSHAGGFLDEEDDSGDDTFDENGEEERGEGPTYVAGADGAGHGDSSSSSSSESVGADHWRYRSYPGSRYEPTYRQGGASSSSQEEESYDFEDEAMQGDDPSVFDGLGSSYKVRYAGPRAMGSSREGVQEAGSHHWEEGDSRSPEVEDSGEDSPSVEDNSQSEEPVDSQSEEESSSRSREDGDGEDSPSREDEDSKSRESTEDQSDEEPRESPEVVNTLNQHSWNWEGQEDRESAEDRSVLSTPDSESGEEEGEQSKSREDDDAQSQSTEESREDENDSDSEPSTSAESQSASPEDDSSPEDNTGEDSRSTESADSESQEDGGEDSPSQEDATRESSSHGDDNSLQSLGSASRRRRPGALRSKPAADYDDNDCQDGY